VPNPKLPKIPLTPDELTRAKADIQASRQRLKADPGPAPERGPATRAAVRQAHIDLDSDLARKRSDSPRPPVNEHRLAREAGWTKEQIPAVLDACDEGWNTDPSTPIQDARFSTGPFVSFNADFPNRLADEYPRLSLLQKIVLVGVLRDNPPIPSPFPARKKDIQKYLANCSAVAQVYKDASEQRRGAPTRSKSRHIVRMMLNVIATRKCSVDDAADRIWSELYPCRSQTTAAEVESWRQQCRQVHFRAQRENRTYKLVALK